MFQQDKN